VTTRLARPRRGKETLGPLAVTAVFKRKAQLSARWLLVPAGILALVVLIPIGFGIAHLRRSRRAWRTCHAR
jgi:hypothetical protein